jgi:hypothetical protein
MIKKQEQTCKCGFILGLFVSVVTNLYYNS